jgi:glycosyltransferase involved in cell wall biosynthesis
VHILFLTDNFPPEVNAPASRTFEHCREWVKAGHKVTVITCAPNFPKGRVFDDYKNKLYQRETMAGIEVIRVWTYITANEGFVRRVLDYLSFMVAAIIAGPFVRKVDLVVGTSPQFFTICAAFVVSFLKRRPFVFELRDLWPESIKAVGAMQDSFALHMLEHLEMFLYRRAAKIVSVTESFKKVLVRRGIDGGKIEVVTNGVDVSQFQPRPKDVELTKTLGLEGKFVAGYIGTHGMAHALETLLEAAGRLQNEGFAFLFLGDGARKQALMDLAKERGVTNVVFVDSVPKADVAKYWSLLDVSIIHLRKTELFTTVIPSKLFECMGMGIPVLHGVQGESADIVREYEVGVPFEPENVDQLCEALRQFKGDPKSLERFRANCLAGAIKFDRVFLANKMLGILERTVAGRGRAVHAAPAAPVAPAATEPPQQFAQSFKVLLLNQVFWPDVAATAQHGHDLAKYLVQHGDQVTAVASRSIYGESGGTLSADDSVDGIRVLRVGKSMFGKSTIAGRGFDFVAFYLAALFKALRMPRQDVVICLTTPPFIALVGVVLKWVKGTQFVLWSMDLYPEVPAAAGVLKKGSFAHRFFQAIDRFCMRRADRVVVLGRCMRDRVLAKGVDPAKVEMINVWADPEEVHDVPRHSNQYRSEWNIGDRFVLEYSGNLGIGHDEATMLDAMRRTRNDEGLRWVIVGGGTKKADVDSFVSRERIDNAVLRPYQPRARLADLISLGDAHLVTVAEGFEGLMVPSKFYGVLAAARPTIYVGPESSEVAQVIQAERCGLVVRQGDGPGLAEAVRRLAADPAEAKAMGERGRDVLVRRYGTPIACARWQAMLHQTMASRR